MRTTISGLARRASERGRPRPHWHRYHHHGRLVLLMMFRQARLTPTTRPAWAMPQRDEGPQTGRQAATGFLLCSMRADISGVLVMLACCAVCLSLLTVVGERRRMDGCRFVSFLSSSIAYQAYSIIHTRDSIAPASIHPVNPAPSGYPSTMQGDATASTSQGKSNGSTTTATKMTARSPLLALLDDPSRATLIKQGAEAVCDGPSLHPSLANLFTCTPPPAEIRTQRTHPRRKPTRSPRSTTPPPHLHPRCSSSTASRKRTGTPRSMRH